MRASLFDLILPQRPKPLGGGHNKLSTLLTGRTLYVRMALEKLPLANANLLRILHYVLCVDSLYCWICWTHFGVKNRLVSIYRSKRIFSWKILNPLKSEILKKFLLHFLYQNSNTYWKDTKTFCITKHTENILEVYHILQEIISVESKFQNYL